MNVQPIVNSTQELKKVFEELSNDGMTLMLSLNVGQAVRNQYPRHLPVWQAVVLAGDGLEVVAVKTLTVSKLHDRLDDGNWSFSIG